MLPGSCAGHAPHPDGNGGRALLMCAADLLWAGRGAELCADSVLGGGAGRAAHQGRRESGDLDAGGYGGRSRHRQVQSSQVRLCRVLQGLCNPFSRPKGLQGLFCPQISLLVVVGAIASGM